MKQQAISLGRIGIVLPLAGAIPYVGTLTAIISVILLLIAYYNFSKYYNEQAIWRNYLWSFLVNIIMSVILVVFFAITIISFLKEPPQIDPQDLYDLFKQIIEYISLTRIITGVLIALGGTILSYFLQYKAKQYLAQKTGVKEFNTSGLLQFIGACTIILIGLGFILIFVGYIFEIVAFYNTNPTDQEQTTEYTN